MKKTLILLALFFLNVAQLTGEIHNVPDNYSSIQAAIDASVNSDTILVEPNTYFENIDYKGKNIVIGSLFLTTNDTSMISQTIINGSGNGSVVTIENNEDSTAMLIGLTITNGKATYGGGIYIRSASPSIYNCIITDNIVKSANPFGGGIYMRDNKSTIYDCEISYNTATGQDNSNGWGGGIASIASSGKVSIINCKIHHNQATSLYGGIGVVGHTTAEIIGCEIDNNFCYATSIGCQDSDVKLINNSIVKNKQTLTGAAFYFIRSSPVLYNCIIWYNEGSVGIDGWGGTPEIFYSNIQGGFDTLAVLDQDPLFVDADAGNFRLKDGSPCIDTGTPDTDGLNLPMADLVGNLRVQNGNNTGVPIIDMGAYEYGDISVRVPEKQHTNRPDGYHLLQNYPNPFNASTQITYYLPKLTAVNLSIYNMLGQKIITLVNNLQSEGNHSAIWTGLNYLNYKTTSGVYLYQLKAGNSLLMHKMILLE